MMDSGLHLYVSRQYRCGNRGRLHHGGIPRRGVLVLADQSDCRCNLQKRRTFHTDCLDDHVCLVSISSEKRPSFPPSIYSEVQLLAHSGA